MNNIISISGMPVSGKSTTINKIIETLMKKGYESNQIHLVSTGQEFRYYFNFVIELIKNPNKMNDVIEKYNAPKIKELLNNSNFRKSLIRTIIAIRQNGYDLQNFTIEQANNLEYFKDLRYIIDTLIDSNIADLGKKLEEENIAEKEKLEKERKTKNNDEFDSKKDTENKKRENFWIIDSRLAFNNIPNSFSVRLVIDEDIAAKRLLKDNKRGKEDNKYKNEKEAKKAIINRKNGEVKRYLERYNVDLEDLDNYDLVIDTSYANVEDIANTILDCHENYKKNKYFGKMWTSPKKLLPLQIERATVARGNFFNMDEMIESINDYGYLVNEEIEVVEVDGKMYIIEGHHRNFGAALAGKTIVPYMVLAKDDEIVKGYGNITAREKIFGCDSKVLKGHEWMLGDKFSYTQIYPNIYKELEQNDAR